MTCIILIFAYLFNAISLFFLISLYVPHYIHFLVYSEIKKLLKEILLQLHNCIFFLRKKSLFKETKVVGQGN
ncbi:hypothetical protein BJ944DRAFT_122067 [Cunninghamella echinulata]|nr:hypothetical protein BJ944DRAFT_122067 [Cunninghamella echinulata]